MTSAEISDLRSLGPEERERLLSALRSESDKIMLRLLLETGRSLDDFRGARVADLDRDRSVLRLRRVGARETDETEYRAGDEPEIEEVPLSPELSAAVGDYLERNPGKTRIFEGRCGKPVGPKWFRCAIEPVVEELGLRGSAR
jgi:integrase